MSRVFRLEARFQTDPDTLDRLRAMCSPSGKHIWVDRATRLRLHTLRGVPGKLVDVLLPADSPAGPIACEIGRKTGCFDGAIRWRLSFRPWQWIADVGRTPVMPHIAHGKLDVSEAPDGVEIVARWHGGLWAQLFPQLRYVADERTDRRGIFIRQAQLWFSFLPPEEVHQTAEVWCMLPAVQTTTDIVVLNRTASHMLYDLATGLGWRKLTLREKARCGLAPDSPQWQRRDGLAMRLAAAHPTNGSVSGCGQYTLAAAHGRDGVRLPRGVCPACHEIAEECACG